MKRCIDNRPKGGQLISPVWHFWCGFWLWLLGRPLHQFLARKIDLLPVSARHLVTEDSEKRVRSGSIIGRATPPRCQRKKKSRLRVSTSSRANFLHALPMLRRVFSHAAKMSTYTTDKASPFTTAVVAAMRKLYARSRVSSVEKDADLFTADIPRNWLIRVLTIPVVSCQRFPDSVHS